MPTISQFRGIKIYINWSEHNPPHFHARYCGDEVSILINEIEVLNGDLPNKQLKMLLGWTALHQDELLENWKLAAQREELFEIDPLK